MVYPGLREISHRANHTYTFPSRAIIANDRTQEDDNNSTVTTASDNEAASQACSSPRRSKLKKTDTRPRQQWESTMQKVLVNIMCIEQAKEEGSMARAKQPCIDQDKVEELLQEKDRENETCRRESKLPI